MIEDQYLQELLSPSREDRYQLLSRMRKWVRDAKFSVRDGPLVSSGKEFQDALSILDEVATNTRFAEQRQFPNGESVWCKRGQLELNLEELLYNAESVCSLDAEVKNREIQKGPNLNEVEELKENQKLKKAEQALRRLLAIQEC